MLKVSGRSMPESGSPGQASLDTWGGPPPLRAYGALSQVMVLVNEMKCIIHKPPMVCDLGLGVVITELRNEASACTEPFYVRGSYDRWPALFSF